LEAAGFEAFRGRVKVDEYMQPYPYPEVFIIGDCSLVTDPEGRPYPANAQIAVQQAFNVAHNLTRKIRRQPLHPFVFDNKGVVASLGKGKAVGLLKQRKIKGHFAAMMKRLIDARYLYLIGGLSLVVRKVLLPRRIAN
jgi:NADH dehydrogenase